MTTTTDAGGPTRGEYDLRNGGLLVILRNNKFSKGLKEPIFDDYDYSEEEHELRKLFGFPEIGEYSNLISVENVIPDEGMADRLTGGTPFETVLDRIRSKDGESFGFLFMVIMSHGYEDGSFALAGGDNSERKSCCDSSADPVCRHSYQGGCHYRRTYDDVIAKIETDENFLNKPKIFLAHVCRGQKSGSRIFVKGDSGSPGDTQKFIPVHSDSLIMHASPQGYQAFSPDEKTPDGPVPGMSLLIKTFISVINSTKRTVELKTAELEQLKAFLDAHDFGKGCSGLERRVETYTGAWLLDVCCQVSAQVAKTRFRFDGKIRLQQPVIWSTLRKRLSVLEMLKRLTGEENASTESQSIDKK